MLRFLFQQKNRQFLNILFYFYKCKILFSFVFIKFSILLIFRYSLLFLRILVDKRRRSEAKRHDRFTRRFKIIWFLCSKHRFHILFVLKLLRTGERENEHKRILTLSLSLCHSHRDGKSVVFSKMCSTNTNHAIFEIKKPLFYGRYREY